MRVQARSAQRPFLPFLFSFSAHFRHNPHTGHAFGRSRCAPERAANGPASRMLLPVAALRAGSPHRLHLPMSPRRCRRRSHLYRRRCEKSAKKSALS